MAGSWRWDAATKRSWWCSLAVAAVLGVPACSSGPEVEVVERALVAEAGPPIAGVTVFEAPWHRGAGVWYEHRYDPLAVFEWLDALPERLDCESHESDELIPPADGWSALYWFSCCLRRGATSEGHC